VRKEFSPFRFAVCALCLFSLFASRANAQDKDQKQDHPNGIVQDWSRHHLAYPRFGPIQSIIAVQHDPRAILSWQEAEREDWHRAKDRDEDRDGDGDHRHSHGTPSGVHRDWSIPLGLETTAPAMYPAKYTFYLTAAPSCSTDFIVYPVNVAGSTTQPNIVAFNNLYSGTVPSNGVCNRPSPVNDDGVSATTMWSYFVQAAGGVVATSPTLSLDGTRVAFVESVSGISAQFHVLAWKSGDGVTTTAQSLSVPGAQNVLIPATINTFVGLAPVAGSGTATNLTLGSTGDTLSSPFVDYNNDVAYVGNDSGTLFRVKDVFCTTPACISGGTPAPSLDASWGLGGVLATTCPGKLTGPVVAGNGNIFVGCSDGKLYGFTPTGSAITGSPLTVGNGGSTGGIVDPPLVDVVNGFVYVVSGNSSGGSSVLVQAGATSFTSPAPVIATLGAGGHFNLHAPAFNNAYFSASFSTVANVQGTVNPGPPTTTGNTSNWQVNEWADSGVAGSPATLYGVGFNSSGHDMTSGAASNFIRITSSLDAEFSPLTQLLNGGTDQLFVSALLAATTPPNTIVYNLTDFPGLFPNVFPNPPGAAGATATEGSGTTGIVVDNVSGQAQASSIYFGALVANTAVKLTQSGLN
jgi:hypothetical protein